MRATIHHILTGPNTYSERAMNICTIWHKFAEASESFHHLTPGADWTVGKSVIYRIKFTKKKKKKKRKEKKRKEKRKRKKKKKENS